MSNSLTEDLETCDREPVRFIASIQSRGFLIAFSQTTYAITNVTENIGNYLGCDTSMLVGLNLEDALGIENSTIVLKKIQSPEWRERRRLNFRLPEVGDKHDVDAFLFESDDLCVLEVEISSNVPIIDPGESTRQEITNIAVASIREAQSFSSAGRALCSAIRQLTNLDRIMVYRFHQSSWNGEVIAEDKIAGAHSFFDHFFPASDIPKPARDLYLRNRLRFIQDSSASSWNLVPSQNPLHNKPFDLSDSRLRGVSPVHLEYLKNMGVACSFSLAVICNEKLWGLVACHGSTSQFLTTQLRAACEILVGTYAVRARLEDSTAPAQSELLLETRLREVTLLLSASNAPQADLLRYHRNLEEAFQASGLALVIGEKVDLAGLTPPRYDVLKLAKELKQKVQETKSLSLALTNLSELDPYWERYSHQTAGVLALQVPHVDDGMLLIFRAEHIKTIKWGGDPRKQLENRDYPGRINPRNSFESWTEIRRNHSPPWALHEIKSACHFRDLLFNGFVRRDQLIQELSTRKSRE